MPTPDRPLSFWREIRASLDGPWRGILLLAWIEGLLFFAVLLWAAFAFFDATTTRDQILYATVFLVCAVFIAIIKLFYYGYVNRCAVLRGIEGLRARMAEIERRLAGRA